MRYLVLLRRTQLDRLVGPAVTVRTRRKRDISEGERSLCALRRALDERCLRDRELQPERRARIRRVGDLPLPQLAAKSRGFMHALEYGLPLRRRRAPENDAHHQLEIAAHGHPHGTVQLARVVHAAVDLHALTGDRRRIGRCVDETGTGRLDDEGGLAADVRRQQTERRDLGGGIEPDLLARQRDARDDMVELRRRREVGIDRAR